MYLYIFSALPPLTSRETLEHLLRAGELESDVFVRAQYTFPENFELDVLRYIYIVFTAEENKYQIKVRSKLGFNQNIYDNTVTTIIGNVWMRIMVTFI